MLNHTMKATVVLLVVAVLVVVEGAAEFNAQAAAGIPFAF
jgi:hypothetical protein